MMMMIVDLHTVLHSTFETYEINFNKRSFSLITIISYASKFKTRKLKKKKRKEK